MTTRWKYSTFHVPPMTSDSPTKIIIGYDNNPMAAHAKNLRVIIDHTMSMSPHISKVCKSVNFHLFRISRIRKYLTLESTIVHSLVSSRLDYCNSILFGLPKQQLNKLQTCLNSAA